MDDTRAQLTQAAKFLKAKEYPQARALLRTIDHPQAREWLQKLDVIDPQDGLSGVSIHPPASKLPSNSAPIPLAGPVEAEPKVGSSSTGFLLFGLLAVLMGIGVGIMMSAFQSSTQAYTFVPIIGAFIMSVVFALLVNVTKVHDPINVLICVVLAGVVAYIVSWGGGYLRLREEIRQVYIEQVPLITNEEVDAILNEALKEASGQTGIPAFIALRASQGFQVNVRIPYFRSIQIPVQNGSAFAYWGIELLLITVIPGLTAWRRASAPFCEAGNRWLKMRDLGIVRTSEREAFVLALESGNAAFAGSLIAAPNTHRIVPPRIEIRGGRCGDNLSEGKIELVNVKVDNKKRTKSSVIHRATLSSEQYQQLVKAIPVKAAAAGATQAKALPEI